MIGWQSAEKIIGRVADDDDDAEVDSIAWTVLRELRATRTVVDLIEGRVEKMTNTVNSKCPSMETPIMVDVLLKSLARGSY